MKLYIGTSGYSYKEWKGKFYPAKLPATKMLHYYSEHFRAVEINSTFRGLPEPSVCESVDGRSPKGLPIRAQSATADHAHPTAQECRRIRSTTA